MYGIINTACGGKFGTFRPSLVYSLVQKLAFRYCAFSGGMLPKLIQRSNKDRIRANIEVIWSGLDQTHMDVGCRASSSAGYFRSNPSRAKFVRIVSTTPRHSDQTKHDEPLIIRPLTLEAR